MKRKSRRRARRGRWIAPLGILILAGVLGWAFFRPVPKPSPTPVVSTPTFAPLPTTTATAVASATQLPTAVASSATPSPVTSESPNTQHGRAKLAIIIDDCGQWINTERGFVALPIPLTLSVLPDVRYDAVIAREAAAAQKGVMLHLPMSTLSGLNPGPGKITTTMSDAQIAAQVQTDLAQIPDATGVNNHEGSRATADPRVMRAVAQALVAHGGLFFIDSRTIADSVAAKVTSAAGLPTASRDVFLDNQANVAYVEGQLRAAATIAQRTGSAIAIGHPRPTTLAALTELYPKLEAEGVDFVLVQSLAH